jgi:hypothetical protein
VNEVVKIVVRITPLGRGAASHTTIFTTRSHMIHVGLAALADDRCGIGGAASMIDVRYAVPRP